MAKSLVVLAIVVAALGLAPPATGQVPETVSVVATAAQYRSALTTLSADNSPGPHTVRLSADITLVADIEPIYTGTQALIIDGDGHTIDGNDLNRAIDHQSNAGLTLRELTIRNGHTPTGNDGGAVATDGPLTITGVTFEDNVAESNGGALETAAGDAVTITDSTFTGNTAENVGGAIESNSPLTITGSTFSENVIDDPVSSSQGGGALSQGAGQATITDSTFTDNQVVDVNDVHGGAIRTSSAETVTLTRVDFTGNTISEGRGGAVHVASATTLVVDDSTFTENRVLNDDSTLTGGGAIHAFGDLEVTGSTFERNDATNAAGGALFLSTNVTATITDSELTDNHTLGASGSGGGAIHSDAALLTVDTTTLAGNSTGGPNADGGAIEADQLVVTDSDLRDNAVLGDSSSGGAVAADDLEMSGTWIVENHADVVGGTGGGIGAPFGPDTADVTGSLFLRNTAEGTSGFGGAIGEVNDLSVTNSSFLGNRAAVSGGAISLPISGTGTVQHASLGLNHAPSGAQLHSGSGTLTVEATVVGLPDGGQDCLEPIGGTITSAGHNRESSTSCGFTQPSDVQNLTNPGLGPLRSNGGTTSTAFPLNGSPLVDQIPAGQCDLDVDQRGVERPYGGECDIGAVEQVFPEHAFRDVPGWVEDAVRWMAFTGNDPQIMVGITPTTFEPAERITRAQVVRMLYNEAGAPDASVYPPHGFTDVLPWVEDAVRWAKGEGIVDGVTPTTFVPNDRITRAQVVRMKYRFAGSPDVTGIDPHPFTDVPVWVEEAVRWAANPDNALPLVTGITSTTFEPTEDITRGQVARMDYRLAITPDAWETPADAPRAMVFIAGS